MTLRTNASITSTPWRRTLALLALLVAATLTACGGGGGGSSSTSDGGGNNGGGGTPPAGPMSARDAHRMAQQSTFGATETLVTQMQAQTAEQWVAAQMAASGSRYTSGRGDAIHTSTEQPFFCDLPQYTGQNCWRDWFSTDPLVWDFYRNAVTQPDQLRQRVAWALSQLLVVSSVSINGTYGFRNYHNMLLDSAFGNYRDLLKKVTLSPVMGDYLNNVNNDPDAPNENFARELLQLFSIGPCRLNAGGALEGGQCAATYDNNDVRNYAYALTGWTYPKGGNTFFGCFPTGANCQYWSGDMVPSAARYRDTAERALLNGAKVPANTGAAAALEIVLDSLMAHPNTAPYVARHLIQQLVTSNPSAGYVSRVGAAFTSGKFGSFGAGRKGDLAATVAAVLLDAEARSETPGREFGRLREPTQFFTGVIRALNGRTDGDVFGWLGEGLAQHAFMPPTVFNYYPPDYPVPGTALVGPAFGIHNANTALSRLNVLVALFEGGGFGPDTNNPVPNAVGTKVDFTTWQADATDVPKLVDRMSRVALGGVLPTAARTKVIDAVQVLTQNTAGNDWKLHRLYTAAFLVFGSPQYQIVR